MSRAAELNVLAEVLGLIESTLKVPADQVDVDANLESFGVNSLIVMELMENIEKRFDVTLTPAQFSNIETVRDLAGLVETLVASEPAQTPGVTGAADTATSQAPGLPATRRADVEGAAGRNGSAPVLDYVRAKYAIDLSQRQFESVDDVVDTLVSDHAADLMRHYGLKEEQGEAPVDRRRRHELQAARRPRPFRLLGQPDGPKEQHARNSQDALELGRPLFGNARAGQDGFQVGRADR